MIRWGSASIRLLVRLRPAAIRHDAELPAVRSAKAPGSGRAGVLDCRRGPPQQRSELAAFLRARREALTPEQVRLPRGRGRRTPGLRREEVALLAGVSVTWYTWLEQGRRINASTDVLRSIGRALRLDEAGQQHLLALAQPSARRRVDHRPDEVPSALRRLIESFEPAPAYVLGPHWEFAGLERRPSPPVPADRASSTASSAT